MWCINPFITLCLYKLQKHRASGVLEAHRGSHYGDSAHHRHGGLYPL